MLHCDALRPVARRLLATLLLIMVASPAFGQANWAFDYGQWKIAPAVKQLGHPTFFNDGREMLRIEMPQNLERKDWKVQWKQDDQTVRVDTQRHDAPEDVRPGYHFRYDRPLRVESTYRMQDGKLHAAYRMTENGKPVQETLHLELPRWHYAGTEAAFDGQVLRFPAEDQDRSYPDARQVTLYRGVPSRQMGVAVTHGQPLKARTSGDNIVLQATSDARGRLELVVDLSQSQIREVSRKFIGASFIDRDDLHLPDQSLSRNLVQNAGFAGGFAHWSWGVTGVKNSPMGVAGWEVDDQVAWEGKTSARYLIKHGYNPEMLTTFPIMAEPGTSYTLSFYARTDTPGAKLSILGQHTRWGIFEPSDRIALTRDWKRYTYTFEAPLSFFRIAFGERWWDEGKDDQIDGAQVWLDGVQIERGSAATPFTQKPIVAYATVPAVDNVYEHGAQSMPVTVTVVNATDQPRPVRMDASIQDLDRRPLLTKTIDQTLSGGETVSATFDLAPLDRLGLVRVVMHTRSQGHEETFYGRAGVFEPITDPGHVVYGYGLSPDDPFHNQGAARSQHQVAHAAKVRRDRLRSYGVWGSIAFHPPDDPSVIREINDENWLHLFRITLGPENPEGMSGKLLHQSKPMTEAMWRQFDKAVATRAARYPEQKYWKTVNEPGDPAWPPSEVARAVGVVYRNVKKVNPDAIVISPEMAGSGLHRQRWLEEFLKAGGAEVVDTLAIHTYRDRPEDPSLQADIDALNDLRQRYDLTEHKMLFTEGEGRWDYTLDELNMAPYKSWSEFRLKRISLDVGQDELLAAAIHTRTLLACFRNHDSVGMYLSWNMDFQDGMPRATLFGINHLYALLRNATFVEEMQIGQDTRTYLFEREDGVPVVAMWSYDLKVDRGQAPAPQGEVPVPDDASWQLQDMMGNPVENVQHRDGKMIFDVSGRPVYLLAHGSSTSDVAQALRRSTIGGGALRSVDLRLRMDQPGKAQVHVDNRLLRRIEGTLAVRSGEATLAEAPINIAPRASQVLGFDLPSRDATAIGEVPMTMVFTDAETGGESEIQPNLRWLSIPRLPAGAATDGTAAGWNSIPTIPLDPETQLLAWGKRAWDGPDDLSASMRLAWRPDGLYALVEVRDNAMSTTDRIEDAWRGDSLQLYLDVYGDGMDAPDAGYDESDQALTIARIEGKPVVYREQAPNWQVGFVERGVSDRIDAKIDRDGDLTRYFIHLPLKDVQPLTLEPGTSLGLALLVNDADGQGRKQSLTTTAPGTQPFAKPALWPIVVLSE